MDLAKYRGHGIVRRPGDGILACDKCPCDGPSCGECLERLYAVLVDLPSSGGATCCGDAVRLWRCVWAGGPITDSTDTPADNPLAVGHGGGDWHIYLPEGSFCGGWKPVVGVRCGVPGDTSAEDKWLVKLRFFLNPEVTFDRDKGYGFRYDDSGSSPPNNPGASGTTWTDIIQCGPSAGSGSGSGGDNTVNGSFSGEFAGGGPLADLCTWPGTFGGCTDCIDFTAEFR